MSAAAPGPTVPASAPFIIPAAGTKHRVRIIGAEGQEEAADDNPWVHMQLKDPFQQQVGASTAQHSGRSSCCCDTTQRAQQDPRTDLMEQQLPSGHTQLQHEMESVDKAYTHS